MTSANTSTRTLTSGAPLKSGRVALIAAGGVLCFGLLSFFGHLVQTQVQRGESFREAQRAGLYGIGDVNARRGGEVDRTEITPLLARAIAR